MIFKLRYITTSVLFFIHVFAMGQSSHGININYGYGTLVAHRNAMNHMLKGNSHYFDINYVKRTDGSKPHHLAYKYPWFGVGANFITSGNPAQIGNVGGLYTFGILRLAGNADFPLRIKVGAGLGYVQHIFNIQTNHQAIAIGSHINSNMLFIIEKNFLIHSANAFDNELYVGFGLTHFSNASFKVPNLGLNFLTLNLGYQLGSKPFLEKNSTVDFTVNLKNEWSVVVGAGIKEQPRPTYPKYGIGIVNIQYERIFNIKSSALLSLDFTINSSHQVFNKSYFQQGIFSAYMLHFNKLKIGAGMGIYTLNKTFDELPLYHKLIIEYNVFKSLNLQLCMRTHWASADFVSLNFKYRLWQN